VSLLYHNPEQLSTTFFEVSVTQGHFLNRLTPAVFSGHHFFQNLMNCINFNLTCQELFCFLLVPSQLPCCCPLPHFLDIVYHHSVGLSTRFLDPMSFSWERKVTLCFLQSQFYPPYQSKALSNESRLEVLDGFL